MDHPKSFYQVTTSSYQRSNLREEEEKEKKDDLVMENVARKKYLVNLNKIG